MYVGVDMYLKVDVCGVRLSLDEIERLRFTRTSSPTADKTTCFGFKHAMGTDL